MLISHRHRFIFVHPQKTAGSSIETVLKARFPDAIHWHGRHGHAQTGLDEIGRERWKEYFSFGFVRNPWDRLVSWYSMIQMHRERLPLELKSSRSPFDVKLWNQVVQEARGFDSFLERCTEVVFDMGALKSFAFNQVDYLGDRDGKMLVNFVGRFENLANDAADVFRRLGVEESILPWENASQHGHYSQWYNDHTRDLVAKRFARDIATFGYTFENSHIRNQI